MVAVSTFILSLSLGFLLISSSSDAAPFDPHPQEHPSFQIRQQQQSHKQGEDEIGVGVGVGCTYTVKIKTSCSSPRYTRDYVSIAFGDLYRNEVYVPRLDDPASRTFESCSTDTFNIQGPCGYGVCYLYLRRSGWDGWIPESVKIYERSYGRSITFYYNTPLPNSIWYGFNNCPRAVSSSNTIESSISDLNLLNVE